MIKLQKSDKLGRMIRQDDPLELANSTFTLVRDAIRAGQAEQALNFLDYGIGEMKMLHDSMCSFVDDALTYLSRFGDEEVYKAIRKRYEPTIRNWLRGTPGVKESLERAVEFQRGHGGACTIREEADKFIVTCDPCGSGGQMRRTKNLGKLERAYDWTWNKRGIPIYCTHCAIMWEILPIEMRGYPIRINLFSDDPAGPCVHLYYKDPQKIPREYFTRVGCAPK